MNRSKRRHAEYFAALAQAAESQGDAGGNDETAAALELEYPNLRAALSWATDAREYALAIALTSAMDALWLARNQVREGRSWVDRVLAFGEAIPPEHRVKLHRTNMRLRYFEGESRAMEESAREAVVLYRDLGDLAGLGQAQNGLAVALHARGALDEAETTFQECLELQRAIGNKRDLAYTLGNLGTLAIESRGDYAKAGEIFRECLQLSADLGDRESEAVALSNLATAEWYLGDVERAIDFCARSLKLARELEMDALLASGLIVLARLELHRGNLHESVQALKKGLAVARRTHDFAQVALAMETFSRIALRVSRFSDGVALLAFAKRYREVHGADQPAVAAAETRELESAFRKALDGATFARQSAAGARATIAASLQIAHALLGDGKRRAGGVKG
ncbi:MAG: tetratricopeptide repeat protein [Candidatus Eremiobacteraeota bacterium]|nr:tetratricopeptide repeat protein [Candidatus Eremiobacteraeota bacterium]